MLLDHHELGAVRALLDHELEVMAGVLLDHTNLGAVRAPSCALLEVG